MKKLVWLLVLFFVISCSNPTKDELINYTNNELPKVASLEAEIISLYDSATGENYKDDVSLYTTLRDDVIPKQKKFVEDLENINNNLKIPEIIKLNETYIEAANIQYSAFLIMLTALEKQDYTLISEANEKLDKGRKLKRQWQIDLNILADKNSVTFNK